MLSFDQIKELIELVSHHGLQGVELERSGFKLSIHGRPEESGRAAADGLAPAPAILDPGMPGPAVLAPPRVAPASAAPPLPAGEAAAEANAHLLRSPIVGTFYASPSPDAEPFVRVGDHVRKGQVLCIVEAMKLMNEIECDVDGEILQIHPKNAQPVEYGEPLFAIRIG
jgi:acetyl-CoA carboxylase biotin carboxyl carrier protein